MEAAGLDFGLAARHVPESDFIDHSGVGHDVAVPDQYRVGACHRRGEEGVRFIGQDPVDVPPEGSVGEIPDHRDVRPRIQWETDTAVDRLVADTVGPGVRSGCSVIVVDGAVQFLGEGPFSAVGLGEGVAPLVKIEGPQPHLDGLVARDLQFGGVRNLNAVVAVAASVELETVVRDARSGDRHSVGSHREIDGGGVGRVGGQDPDVFESEVLKSPDVVLVAVSKDEGVTLIDRNIAEVEIHVGRLVLPVLSRFRNGLHHEIGDGSVRGIQQRHRHIDLGSGVEGCVEPVHSESPHDVDIIPVKGTGPAYDRKPFEVSAGVELGGGVEEARIPVGRSGPNAQNGSAAPPVGVPNGLGPARAIPGRRSGDGIRVRVEVQSPGQEAIAVGEGVAEEGSVHRALLVVRKPVPRFLVGDRVAEAVRAGEAYVRGVAQSAIRIARYRTVGGLGEVDHPCGVILRIGVIAEEIEHVLDILEDHRSVQGGTGRSVEGLHVHDQLGLRGVLGRIAHEVTEGIGTHETDGGLVNDPALRITHHRGQVRGEDLGALRHAVRGQEELAVGGQGCNRGNQGRCVGIDSGKSESSARVLRCANGWRAVKGLLVRLPGGESGRHPVSQESVADSHRLVKGDLAAAFVEGPVADQTGLESRQPPVRVLPDFVLAANAVPKANLVNVSLVGKCSIQGAEVNRVVVA